MVRAATLINDDDVYEFLKRWQLVWQFGELFFHKGTKWYKVISNNNGTFHAEAFIDQEGNIFKPRSWTAPVKSIKGNILSEYLGLEAIGFNSMVR